MTGTCYLSCNRRNNVSPSLFLLFSITSIVLLLLHPISTSSTNPSLPFSSSSLSCASSKVQQLNQWAREAISEAETKFKNVDPVVDPNSNKGTSNQKSIYIAKEFLNSASSSFMDDKDLSKDGDRLVKVGRSLVDLVDLADGDDGVDAGVDAGVDEDEDLLRLGLQNIVEQCDILAMDDLKVPKVRFGKTEIQMPIATIGCMRSQQTWSNKIKTMDQVNRKIQKNQKEILHYAITKLGMNHIETAVSYGSSELQIGAALHDLYEEGVVKREELIIQTKINPMNAKNFRETLDNCFNFLQTDYIDIFSFHGVNLDYHYDMIFNNPNEGEENLIDIIREYQKAGKIRHIGFSTHGQPELIRKLIETDAFVCCNLHYHYFASYTASGGGLYGGNLENVRLMKEKDMGVFVISGYDKGGRLYAPSKRLRSLTLPELEPIQFGSLFLWAHGDLDEEHAPVHTFTIGAARPSDLDEPAVAAYLYKNEKDDILKQLKTVIQRLKDAQVESLGEDWVKSWFKGVPNTLTENDAYQLGQILSLYNLIQAFGMLDYAKDRYGTFDGNLKKWNFDIPTSKNIAKMRGGWGYMPGITPQSRSDYSDLLSEVPERNKEKVMEAIDFVFKYCSKLSNDSSNADIPKGWETAYDMRPWCAFPERR